MSKMSRDEREFQPAAIEIMETPPSPAGRLLGFTLITMLGLTVAWASISHIDIFATLQGKIVPTGGVKVIEPLITGKVTALHVRQGQRVSAGDLLLELDPTEQDADRTRLKEDITVSALISERIRKTIDALRVDAVISTVNLPPRADVPKDVLALQQSLLTQTLIAQQADKQRATQQIAQRRNELATARQVSHERRQLVRVLTEKVEMLQGLSKGGNATRTRLLDQSQLLFQERSNLAREEGRIAELKSSIAALESETTSRRETVIQELLKELEENEKRLSGLRQEFRKAAMRADQSNLYAPVTGTIQQLVVQTIGDVVTTGQQLMMIVPQGTSLEVEAFLENKDKGFVRETQAARIKVETFPFTKYGIIPGFVETVSNDAVDPASLTGQQGLGAGTPSKPASGPLVFPVRISLEKTTISVNGEDVALSPGMSVAAEIKIGDRRVIEYLLDPVLRAVDESLRER